ncbi:uncharacterized protein BX663DRAFT_114187 [Cokeromyces recurvatus]|uniref:uncharacterized protein n=1 Tax=Cokeromyces recurvatus TaxID=90255 RepID=UPI00221E3DD3|nr:uncharacterized protein BX663DRAFT_114187 [Cokeromyces recurvatus]KAI7901151.1 hypothetical protein BX663DRAFT_114187 [Cokeromyces recurvatus]
MRPKNQIQRSPLEQTESEEHLQLYKILFDTIFKEWNKTQNFSKEFNTSLVPSRIKSFSEQFSAQFIPSQDSHTCSLKGLEQLQILSREINHAILSSENAKITCRILLVNFRFCLSVCHEEGLYEIIQLIAEIINKLTVHFLFTRDLLFQELLIDSTHSTLYQLAQAFTHFPFSKLPPEYYIIQENSQVYDMSYTEIIKLSEKYDVLPSAIIKARDTKRTPKEAFPTVKAILEIFTRVAQDNSKSM